MGQVCAVLSQQDVFVDNLIRPAEYQRWRSDPITRLNHRLRKSTQFTDKDYRQTTTHLDKGESTMADNTFERVRKIIVDQLDVDPDDVTMEASFKDDLDADSLDLVELIMAFEEEFGGEISDEKAQEIQTVGDVVTFLDA